MAADARRQQILDGAVQLAREVGYRDMSRDQLATRLGVAVGLINHYFETMAALRTEVLREAVRRELLPLIAAGVIDRHLAVRHVSRDLKQRALASIVTKGR
jgi:AcrR family transcriptional regulator